MGEALLWYWDEQTRLSFKWSGYPNDRIMVEQGGFGEPVVARIHMPERGRGEGHFGFILDTFKRTCQDFVGQVVDALPLPSWRDDEIKKVIKDGI